VCADAAVVSGPVVDAGHLHAKNKFLEQTLVQLISVHYSLG